MSKIKKKTPKQYEIISKYFELKDQFDICLKYFNDIQHDFNLTITPYPQVLQ